MKRSEMLTALTNTLDTLSLLSQLNPPATKEQLAEVLLTHLLAHGMLPPLEGRRSIYDLDLGLPTWDEE